MAILRMKKALVASPLGQASQTIEKLQDIGLIYVRPFEGVDKLQPNSPEAQENIVLANKSLAAINKLAPCKTPFTANFFWPRPVVAQKDYDGLLQEIDFHSFCENVRNLFTEYEQNILEIKKCEEDSKKYLPFKNFDIPLTKITDNFTIFLGTVSKTRQKDFLELDKLEHIHAKILSQNVALLAVKKDIYLKEAIDKSGFVPIESNNPTSTPEKILQTLGEKKKLLLLRQEEIIRVFKTDFSNKRRNIEAYLDKYESMQTAIEAQTNGLSSENAFLVVGYTLEKNIDSFKTNLAKHLPSSKLILLDVPEDEEPPVKLQNNPYTRAFEAVTCIYGPPSYRGLDSTFIVSIIFPIFFGFCFGDVLYGLMLVALSLWYLKIFKTEQGAKNFFNTFLICGIATIIIGALTGSWGGNLVSSAVRDPSTNVVISSANDGIINWLPLVSFRDAITLIDPMKQTITFFIVTLVIGIGTQFLGILIAAFINIRQGKWLDAILDQGSWIIFLSGLVMFAMDFLGGGGLPGTLKLAMNILLFSGLFMLVLFQGRSSKNFFGRIGYGLVSLYGILGGYGSAAFLGDVMSYSRLLALGLTTSIVGMAFNTMAGMIGFSSAFGSVLTILILFIGHGFNFVLNIVGSFVHPARLSFLEFYSRFFSAGGQYFEPFTYTRKRIKIMEE